MSDEALRTIIYWIVIILAPINVYAAVTLLRLSHSYNGEIGALSERATVAALLAIGSVAGAVLAASRLTENPLPPTISVLLNGVGAIMLGIPAVWWAIKYKRRGFGDDDDG